MKETKKILSIDWDYFVEASKDDRMNLFPDVTTGDFSSDIRNIVWSQYYRDSKIYDVGIKQKEFENIKIFLGEKNIQTYTITENHMHIVSMLANNFRVDKFNFEIVNIDFHSDILTDNTKLHCGNWLSTLIQNISVTKATWVGSNNSIKNIDVLNQYVNGLALLRNDEGINFKYTENMDEVLNTNYDAVFLCLSELWSPPHLDKYFIELVEIITRESSEKNIIRERLRKVEKLAKNLEESIEKLKDNRGHILNGNR